MIGNLDSVLKTINGKGDALADLVSTLQRLVSGLAGDRAAIGDAVSGIADLTDATAGLFEQARPGLQAGIKGLGDVSANLNKDSGDVDKFLDNLPKKLNELGRVSSYGSWMNFYLCSAVLQSKPPRGVPATAARCGA